MNSDLPASIDFGRFRVLPRRRELLVDGQPARLGGRAFDVLITLINARGAVVTKDVLMAQVWPDRVVEENNLQIHVSALRAALGADRDLIRTVSGRGYQFSGDIQVVPASSDEPIDAVAAQRAAGLPPTNAPMRVSELIGRDTDLEKVARMARAHRLVTLTGIGGIGKTMLALALARELRPHFADGVWLAEFSAVGDPQLVPSTIAAAVGLELGGGEVSARRVAQALGDRRLLLVLDTCEHVIAAVATMVEAVLGISSAAHIIATSREALRAAGERVYPVHPLAVSAENVASVDDLLQYGAVRLFIERVAAADPHFAPDPRSVTMIAAICRRLDGIPLAIELAAARAPALGVETLAARIDDRFRLLAGGRRTALARHQALRATFDWSYELLAEPERMLLRRLAVFAGAFSLDAAVAVAASPDLSEPGVIDALLGLVAKSLALVEILDTVERYRLLDTTRAYALAKLQQSGEDKWLLQQHAEYYWHLFEQAEVESETRPGLEWLHGYGWCINNLRAALDWAFSPDGHTPIGVALTAAAVPLWTHLSLMEECRGRVVRALAVVAGGAAQYPRDEMRLQTALATSLHYTSGAVSEMGAAAARALEIAGSVQDDKHQLSSLWWLWRFQVSRGGQSVAMTLAQQFHAVAARRSDAGDLLIGERMMGASCYYLGDLLSARRRLEYEPAHDVSPTQTLRINWFDGGGRRASILARVLWLLGLPDQAMRSAEASLEDAQATNHAMSVGGSLALSACQVALWIGDLTAVEHYTRMLSDHLTRHALGRWRVFCLCYQAILVMERGDLGTGLRQLRAAFAEPAAIGSIPRFFTSVLAKAQGRAGQVNEGLAAIEEIVRVEHAEERWLLPELLHVRGGLILSQGASNATGLAEDQFRQAIDLARRQGALSWELRAATSLARLWRDQGRSTDAHALLAQVYDRFTEGFATADLRAARSLLDELA